MNKRSFSAMYALRELKTRRKTFLPAMLISIGTMILMLNVMIYVQSKYTSDLAYYKIDTQLIMPDLDDTEAARLRELDEVKSVEAVRNGGSYICYVELKDKYLESYAVYAQTGLSVMEKLNLTDRAPYSSYCSFYEKYGLRKFSENSEYFNWRYMCELRDDAFGRPEFFFMLVLAALMNFAAMLLVFSMKIRRGMGEYASMKAMGATVRDMRRINSIEALGITFVSFPLALALSCATMKLMCRLSQSLYPEYKMNSVLYFDVPVGMIALMFALYLISTCAAVYFAMRPIAAHSVTELSRGAIMKIPYVAKSSAKLVNSRDFSLYGKIETRRNIKNYLPTQILFCLLVMLPMYFFAAIIPELLKPAAVFEGTPEGYSYIYEFSSSHTFDEPGVNVTRSLVDIVNSIDGCKAVPSEVVLTGSSDGCFVDYVSEYNGMRNSYRFEQRNDIKSENIPEFMTCIAPAELYKSGDTIKFSYGGRITNLKVSRTEEGLFNRSQYYKLYNARIIISDETLAAIMGWDEPRYESVYIYGETGREEELIRLIDNCLEMGGDYINDYDRQLHQGREYDFYGSAAYIERKINGIYAAFLEFFLLAECVYLFICAGLVIYSVCAYEVGGRKKEFTVLRALGLEKEETRKIAVKKQVKGIIFMALLAAVVLIIAALLMNDEIDWAKCGELLKDSENRIYAVAYMAPVIEILLSNLAVFATVTISYGLCAYRAAAGEVEKMYKYPISEAVKGE